MKQLDFVRIVNGIPTIDVAALRHTITISSVGPTSPPTFDAGGAAVTGPVVVTTALAAIDAVRGTDVIKGGQITTQLFLTVALWWQGGILPNMQVATEGGSTYLIQSVENVLEMNAVLILNCIGIGSND